MTHEAISQNLRRFINDHITSVAQLEMLLAMRNDPSRRWSSDQLARELRTEPAWVLQQAQNLRDRGLLESSAADDPQFRYAPRTPELDALVTALAQAYLLHRVTVIELVYSKPPEAMRALSDAFRFRKDRPSG
jgi:hypothetical protein